MEIEAAEARRRLPELTDILVDAVDGGGGNGFLRPLAPTVAFAYWEARIGDIEAGRSILLGSLAADGALVGIVVVDLAGQQNGQHRAEVTKLMARAAQGIGLRLAAPLGHRLGEVGEEDGEPEPERDRKDKAALARQRGIDEGANPLDGRDDAAHLDDEHDRVARLDAWVELLERVHDGAADNLAIEERGGAAWTSRFRHLAADAAWLLWRLLPAGV